MKTPATLLAIAGLILATASPVHPQGSEWEQLIQQAGQLYRAGEFERAMVLVKQVLQVVETALGPNHLDVAVVLNTLAGLYHAQRRYARAEPLGARALAIRETALGPEHPDVAASLEDLAALCRQTGRDTEAELLEKRAAGIRAIRR